MIEPPDDLSLGGLTKALLLCQHATELSGHFASALHPGAAEGPVALQTRKHTIIVELAALVGALDPAGLPDLQHAIERLRTALREEMSLLSDAANDLRNELLTVGTAQRRLGHALHYETAAHALRPVAGDQLSACG